MDTSTIMLIFFSLTEIALLCVVVLFFIRLRKSEALVTELQAKQEEFINRLHFNTRLEHELVATFEQRQQELATLNSDLEKRISELKRLLSKADEYSKSPNFLREIIISGHRSGRSTAQLAKENNLSLEEVELILDQA